MQTYWLLSQIPSVTIERAECRVQDYRQTLAELQQQMNQLKVLLIVGAEIGDESEIEVGQD